MNFQPEKWQQIKSNYSKWWQGKLERPLIYIQLNGAQPARKEPEIPAYSFIAQYDFSIPAEQIVDRWDYDLESCIFLGDAFPSVWPNFGPGVLAAFLGANLIVGENTCWFKPETIKPIEKLHFSYDPANRWFLRVKEICRSALKRWQGGVQIGMTDLGGSLDVVSTFRPGETLLLDLYDNPSEIKRVLSEVHKEWWLCFNEINSIIQPINPGYTAWTPIFSSEPYYMLQCDFSYMIGPEMFDEFVVPELRESCSKLSNAFYHLDGIGQLPHLDSLLKIPELKGIQWVPGAGKPPAEEWIDVLKKIQASGKLIHICGGDFNTLDKISRSLPSLKGIILFIYSDISKEKEALALLKRYGISA
jgi:5-methyltetrahydrofolate--homocysteine methyltransferase